MGSAETERARVRRRVSGVWAAPVIAGVALGLWACSGFGPHSMKPRRLEALMQATVLVQCPQQPFREAGGLLVAGAGSVGYVATSRGILLRHGALLPSARVVAGSGTEDEVVLEGRRLADDADRDLAILAVEWPDRPAAVELEVPVQWDEERPAVLLGFHEAGGRHEPRPCAVISGRVFGAYHDGAGDVVAFAFEAKADADHWHSGGPVLDREGSLLGLAGPLEHGLRTCGVLPISRVASFLDGRVQTIQIWEERVWPGGVELGVEVELFDPLARASSLSLLVFEGTAVSFSVAVGADGRWPRLGDPVLRQRLVLDDGRAAGAVVLTSSEHVSREMAYQVEVRTSNGAVWFSPPRTFHARFTGEEGFSRGAGPPAVGGQPAEPPRHGI